MTVLMQTPPPVLGRPWIRRIRFRKELISQYNRLEEVVLEETMFMDPATCYPKWVFCTIVDRIRSVSLVCRLKFQLLNCVLFGRSRNPFKTQIFFPLQSSTRRWSTAATLLLLFRDRLRFLTRAICWERLRSVGGQTFGPWPVRAPSCCLVVLRC